MAGRIATTFDAKWKPVELEQRLAVSSPSVLITTKELVGRSGNTDSCIIIWEDALKQIRTCDASWALEIDGDTPFFLGFTSGTTGLPKAFVRSHHSWIESFTCNQRDLHLDKRIMSLSRGHSSIPIFFTEQSVHCIQAGQFI